MSFLNEEKIVEAKPPGNHTKKKTRIPHLNRVIEDTQKFVRKRRHHYQRNVAKDVLSMLER
jgi:hypothetical protein